MALRLSLDRHIDPIRTVADGSGAMLGQWGMDGTSNR